MRSPFARSFALAIVMLRVVGVSVAPVGAKGGQPPPPPPPSQPPTLSSVSFSPASVGGGNPATGTVRFSTATDGAVVSLSSSDPVVSVPSETVVNGGASSGAFAVTTTAVSTTHSVIVTATAFGVSRTGTLTVSPAAAPTTDTVKIVRATWSKGLLRIEATSTNPNAILTVYLTVSNSFMFTLTNNGGGRYSDQRGWVDNPRSITVSSNFGGSATAST